MYSLWAFFILNSWRGRKACNRNKFLTKGVDNEGRRVQRERERERERERQTKKGLMIRVDNPPATNSCNVHLFLPLMCLCHVHIPQLLVNLSLRLLNQIDKQIMMCLFFPRLAFERALTLDPLCTGAMTGLAILELNSKRVSMPH